MIKAIETVYKGYRFRSRLEARWAVFLDALDVKWEYEKEGYAFDGDYYLPDFWLPEYNLWIEIKGEEPCGETLQKIRKFRDCSNNAIVVFHGIPRCDYGTLFAWDITDSSGGSYDELVLPTIIETQKGFVFGFKTDADCRVDRDRTVYAEEFNYPINIVHNGGFQHLGMIHRAAEAAKSARFEHGECG